MISYIGGKSIIGKWIRDYIPTDIETYVETFGGMFWVYFCMEDKYPNLKNIVYNDFNQLNSNLFDCVRGTNYKSFGDLLMLEDCQNKDIADTPEQLQLHIDTFNSYQKEIFTDGFEITDSNKLEVAKKYAFVLTQIFSGSQPGKSKYIDFKGKYKPKFMTFREKLTTERYDKFQKQLEKINIIRNEDYSVILDEFDSPKTYFYVDPPYWKTESYYSKHDFDRDDHEKLCTQLKNIKGKFGLSYYDFELLKEWLPKNEFTWEEKQFTKQAGTKKDGTRDKGTELLIMNYEMNPLHEGESIKKINSYLTTDLKDNKLIGEFFDNE
jgi:DNA adenine methylase